MARVIDEARLWRKRHGGTLFGMWPNAASALAGLRTRLPRMPKYVAHAGAIAERLRGAPGVEIVPNPPHTNMMRIHLRVTDKAFNAAAVAIARDIGVFTWPQSAPGPTPSYRTVEFTVGDATLEFKPAEAAEIVARLVQS